MRCEVIAVGTELLLGQIVDTNSAWMGEQLALAGIDSHYQTKVGDNLERIVSCIRLALERSDAVIMCGGLGPTQDDITREAIAEVMGVGLIRRPEIGERIRAMFAARGREMPDNNLRQADVPEGATVMAEMPGTAPGLICPIGDKVVYAVPGVPYEMHEMLTGTVLPDLQRRAGVAAVIKSRVLRTWGQSESGLAEMLGERIVELDGAGNPTLAFQASGIEGIKVRITAKAADADKAEAMLAEEEVRVRSVLGDLVFGVDDDTMESVVLDMLRQRGLSLGVAESLTGGLMGARFTSVPGASDVFRGGVVCYASDVKFSLLGVPPGPVVSAQAAQAMAEGARRVLGADVALATTGVAGPTEQEGQPVGTVFLGLAMSDASEAQQVQLPGDRQRVRQYAVISAVNLLRRRLLGA
ncbi:MAG: competence/damage-inducible protein A [Gammaproteobacteria bacterium]|nr:competence/damage-inducible protein A [Gammaproteobacteria bacterium]NIP88590.1 competence/damage-inducible protein A [Gammaproteobacteria bacterium]NIR23311.1 competence/damage-inducible protein A [Gammaproteobacteria bacterium]NIS04882.1 competence/damage-inducible protein A [Gammaproteobacteria bacterium]NIU40160.1 competence/damage-inducible protein A [Gammaproteobacteria bacterium]